MEFLGFSSDNFEFFRKKEKMSKLEYEKNRNEVKQSFRCLCYDLQKLYHKNTGGVLEVNREFSNFNKRSLCISADYGKNSDTSKNMIEMNLDNICIKLSFVSNNEEDAKAVIEKLQSSKTQITDFLLAERHNQISYCYKGKGNRQEVMKLNSVDVSDESLNAIINSIIKDIENGKYEYGINIQHTCPKVEAIKQEHNLPRVLYDDVLGIMELHARFNI